LLAKKGYILSLGGGTNQMPFLEACKKAGYKSITIDKNTVSPGFAFSDLKIVESITEYRKIYSILLKTVLNAPLVGVGCRSYGKATQSLAYLSEKLGLPGNPWNVVKKFSNKAMLNRFLQERGISVPAQITLAQALEENVRFPLICKPALGDGKKGILKLNSKKELQKISSKIPSGAFLEEFIEGKEFTVLGFVQKGKFHLVSVSDKITTAYPPFLEIAHILPSSQPDLTGEFKFLCQRISTLTGLTNGPLVAEFKVDSRKNIFLIEVAPEVGGEYLAEQLLPNHYGYDYFADYVRLLVGEELHLYDKRKKVTKETLIRFLAPPQGKYKFIDFKKDSVSPNSFVFFEKDLKLKGDVCDSSEGNSSRIHVAGYSRPLSLPREFDPTKTIDREVLLESI
jgi:biotin carboxylase